MTHPKFVVQARGDIRAAFAFGETNKRITPLVIYEGDKFEYDNPVNVFIRNYAELAKKGYNQLVINTSIEEAAQEYHYTMNCTLAELKTVTEGNMEKEVLIPTTALTPKEEKQLHMISAALKQKTMYDYNLSCIPKSVVTVELYELRNDWVYLKVRHGIISKDDSQVDVEYFKFPRSGVNLQKMKRTDAEWISRNMDTTFDPKDI